MYPPPCPAPAPKDRGIFELPYSRPKQSNREAAQRRRRRSSTAEEDLARSGGDSADSASGIPAQGHDTSTRHHTAAVWQSVSGLHSSVRERRSARLHRVGLAGVLDSFMTALPRLVRAVVSIRQVRGS